MRRPLVALAVLSCLGLPACDDGPTQTFTPISGATPRTRTTATRLGCPRPRRAASSSRAAGRTRCHLQRRQDAAGLEADGPGAASSRRAYIGLIDLAGGDRRGRASPSSRPRRPMPEHQPRRRLRRRHPVQRTGATRKRSARRLQRLEPHDSDFCNACGPGYVGHDRLQVARRHAQVLRPRSRRILSEGRRQLPRSTGSSRLQPGPGLRRRDQRALRRAHRDVRARAPRRPPTARAAARVSSATSATSRTCSSPRSARASWSPAHGRQPRAEHRDRPHRRLPAKTLPFSLANPILKLDASGPLGLAGTLGSRPTPCTLSLGLDLRPFNSTASRSPATPARTRPRYNKLLGGAHARHRDLGVRRAGRRPQLQRRARSRRRPSSRQRTCPRRRTSPVELDIDQSTLGVIANDFTNNDPTQPQDCTAPASCTWSTRASCRAPSTSTSWRPAAPAHPARRSDVPHGATPAAGVHRLRGLRHHRAVPASGTVMDCTFVPDRRTLR